MFIGLNNDITKQLELGCFLCKDLQAQGAFRSRYQSVSIYLDNTPELWCQDQGVMEEP